MNRPSTRAEDPRHLTTESSASKPVARASRGLTLGTCLTVLALWIFVRLADEVMESETQRFDAAVVHFFLSHVSVPVRQVMIALTWLASGPSQAVLVICIALYFISRRTLWREAITVLITAFGGMALDEALKHVFHRVRPEPTFYHLGYSFPSGHSFSAVAIYGLLAYLVSERMAPRPRIFVWAVAVVMIVVVGFSRVYLAQHYPTDVIGGYLAGCCWLWGCILWLKLLRRRHLRGAAAQSNPLEPS